MIYTLKEKFTDNLLVLLLVFTRLIKDLYSIEMLIFFTMLTILFGVVIMNSFKIKRQLLSSIIFTSISVLSLFVINFLFANSEQSLDKYLYYFTVVVSSVLFYVHFKNNRGNHIFLLRLNFILKLICIHSLINFIAYFFVYDQLFEINSEYYTCKTYNYLFYYASDDITLSVLHCMD